jgi:hypothetical protein
MTSLQALWRDSHARLAELRDEGEGLAELTADPDEMEAIAGVKPESRDDDHAGLVIVQIDKMLAG